MHKNTGHAYSQDVLSFMLGREGKSVYTGNKKRKEIKQQKMGKSPVKTLLEKEGFHTERSNTLILSHSVGSINTTGTFTALKVVRSHY